MDLIDKLKILNDTDRAILFAVRDNKSYLDEISEASGINLTSLSNSSRKLMELGLIKTMHKVDISYRLTETGRRYAQSGLPEYIVGKFISETGKVSFNNIKVQGLDQKEINAALGILKKIKAIRYDNDAIKIDKEILSKIEQKSSLLNRTKDYDDLDQEELSEFMNRKLIEREEKTRTLIETTEEGRKAYNLKELSTNKVDNLTPDVIKNWENIEFREYQLDSKPPMPVYGKKHITKCFISRIRDILVSMGFSEMQSGYVEAAFWNFDVMMFRQDHPDRDIQDTLYVEGGKADIKKDLISSVKKVYETGFSDGRYNKSLGYGLRFDEKKSYQLIMRGHTTATTFRYIADVISKDKDKPYKFFSVSKVFRNETPDATHLPEFYQIEGVVYDDDLSVADLISYSKEFYKRMGIENIRFKPTYNPYTEPSLEIQAYSTELDRWIEVGNSGVFRQETLAPFGIKKNIIAWGFGLDRILALILGLSDIRVLYGAFSDIDILRSVPTNKIFKGLD